MEGNCEQKWKANSLICLSIDKISTKKGPEFESGGNFESKNFFASGCKAVT